jgi:hypothetical protein
MGPAKAERVRATMSGGQLDERSLASGRFIRVISAKICGSAIA